MMKMINASRVPVLAGGVKARYDLCRREMKADECVASNALLQSHQLTPETGGALPRSVARA